MWFHIWDICIIYFCKVGVSVQASFFSFDSLVITLCQAFSLQFQWWQLIWFDLHNCFFFISSLWEGNLKESFFALAIRTFAYINNFFHELFWILCTKTICVIFWFRLENILQQFMSFTLFTTYVFEEVILFFYKNKIPVFV